MRIMSVMCIMSVSGSLQSGGTVLFVAFDWTPSRAFAQDVPRPLRIPRPLYIPWLLKVIKPLGFTRPLKFQRSLNFPRLLRLQRL